jgi:type II restriction/modification system DNA methylase subunit YeeA
LSQAVCSDVEVIGWLYQFYISSEKDEAFARVNNGGKASASDIPALTQLFTPHYIVKYLAQNSVGRLWSKNHPDSPLRAKLDFLFPET